MKIYETRQKVRCLKYIIRAEKGQRLDLLRRKEAGNANKRRGQEGHLLQNLQILKMMIAILRGRATGGGKHALALIQDQKSYLMIIVTVERKESIPAVEVVVDAGVTANTTDTTAVKNKRRTCPI